MQRLCHARIIATLAGASLLYCALPARSDAAHDYPTSARVEYVLDCSAKINGALATLYQCSCVIDRIALALTYDEFIEASTFAKYATLPGEGGGIFRDSEGGKKQAQRYREVEREARKSCGLK